MRSECKKRQRVFPRTRNPRGCTERMNVKRWMRDWQIRFGSLGVEVIVADVAQSSVVVNVAERTIILSPHLAVYTAERILERLNGWWRRQPEQLHSESCSLVSR
jgi:hypothetical protein